MSIYELSIALDTSHARIIELQEVSRTQRENIIEELKREVISTDKHYKEEKKKSFQL
jgi:hypothetical protein